MKKGILIDSTTLSHIDTIQNPVSFTSFLQEGLGSSESLNNLNEILSRYNQSAAASRIEPEESKIQTEEKTDKSESGVKVVFSYEGEPKKREVKDFTALFTVRYNALKSILQNRKELQNLTSINRLAQKREREQVALIGLVTNKAVTKTEKIIMTIEDPTGEIKVMFVPDNDAYDMAKETVMDEVVGVTGSSMGQQIIFGNSLIIPDMPAYRELKKSPDEAYALFMGDFHFGSNVFITEAFEKFISWIRGEQGNEKQKEVARKVKYLFMVGDLVEGVGIYPNQEDDLVIKDIYEQYAEFAKHIKRIPDHIQIIICPGNHDAMRIAEPQPPLYKDFAAPVWELPNVTMVSSPSYVNIHSSDAFPGFDVLMYHGFSFPYYADVVESIRSQGGQERVDLIMKFLLQRRHLAPAHKSTLYLPDADKDSLVIDKIPDFFATGHIHRVEASSYRNITLLSCSCWLSTTEFQEKMGLHPQPGRAILANLQTRKVKILKFYDEKEEQKDE
ncbi:metallophosphoesterase [Nanoarchaeota archaeon]